MIYSLAIIIFAMVIMALFSINNRDKNVIRRHEFLCFGLLCLGITLSLAIKSGILWCGYHFVDDHEIILFNKAIHEQGIIATMFSKIKFDLSYRFRISYWIFRVLETALFGDNFLLWHLEKTIETSVAIFLFYILLRKMQCNSVLSVPLSLGLLLGPQDAIVWRLGPQELQGLVLYIITLLLIISYQKSKSTCTLVLLVVITLLTGMMKESFLLIVPLFVVFLIYLEMRQEQNLMSMHSVFGIIKKYRVYIVCNLLIVISCLLIIIFYVGTNKIEYAGVDASLGLQGYVKAIKDICFDPQNFGKYFLLLVVSILLYSVYFIWRMVTAGITRRIILNTITGLFILLYGLGTQLVIYAKSGMKERYLIPSVFIVFLFIAFLFGEELYQQKLAYVFIVVEILAILCVARDEQIMDKATAYAKDGYATTTMLKTVDKLVPDTNSHILMALPGELGYSSKVYLKTQFELSNVYAMEDEWDSLAVSDFDMIVMRAYQEEEIVSTYALEIEDYTREEKEGFIIYH